MELDSQQIAVVARRRSGLTKQAFAAVVGTSRGALDQIEKGQRVPRVDTLLGIVRAAGLQLDVTLIDLDGPPAGTDLASAVAHVDPADPRWTWRWLIGDMVANWFVQASTPERRQRLAERPPSCGHPGWDRFVHALAEHLATHAEIPQPPWVDGIDEDVAFWWPVHGDLPSQRAAALAFSPASFKRRNILVDGREIPTIRR